MGGYRHEQFLSTENAIYALKINFILRGVDILAYATGKASIGALILRIIGHQNRWQRIVVWVVIILTALLNVLNTIFNFVQCRPVSANWDRSGSFKCWPAKAQLDFAYFMSGTFLGSCYRASINRGYLFSRERRRRRNPGYNPRHFPI